MASSALAIDVVSDVVCPWCYIGKRRLEQAIALKPEIPVEVRFRPYFLNPWVPREGMSREDYLITKFGSVEHYNKNGDRIVAAAAFAGLTYARDKIKRQPNTLDCHRLIHWADAERQRRPHEAAADGAVFHRRRRSHATARCWSRPPPIAAWMPTTIARAARERQDVERDRGRSESPPRKPASTACPASSSAASSRSAARSRPKYLAQAIERAVTELQNRVAAE